MGVVLFPTMKNCEYTTGIRNSFLRGERSFLIEAPRGRIGIYKHICKHHIAPPCLGEALRRGALIKLHGLMIFRFGCELPSCPFLLSKKNLSISPYVTTAFLNRQTASPNVITAKATSPAYAVRISDQVYW